MKTLVAAALALLTVNAYSLGPVVQDLSLAVTKDGQDASLALDAASVLCGEAAHAAESMAGTKARSRYQEANSCAKEAALRKEQLDAVAQQTNRTMHLLYQYDGAPEGSVAADKFSQAVQDARRCRTAIAVMLRGANALKRKAVAIHDAVIPPRNDQPLPAEADRPKPLLGVLEVTAPEDTEVRVDGKRVGTGNQHVQLPQGWHEVEVRRGEGRLHERFKLTPETNRFTYAVTPSP
ncbi:MAG TPA: hypothetical protein VFG59_02155 [Anaeromyxobacter sp.]|nr:hypothetical protein [Anaeromyxobacter sp.]